MRALNASQKQKVAEFRNVTGATEQQAIEFLTQTKYEVNTAVNRFYELGNTGSGNANKLGNFDKKHEALFNQYVDTKTQKIEIEGVSKLFEDLGLDLMDATTLIISYYFGAKKSGEYTKEEFCSGLQKLGVNTVADLKKKIPQLKQELQSDEGFKNVYKFTFNFSKENAGSKCLEFESAKVLWGILLPFKFTLHKEWSKFIESLPKDKQKDVTSDLWNMLLEFQIQTKGDLKKYDPFSAWPTQIDEFMQFMGYQPPEENY